MNRLFVVILCCSFLLFAGCTAKYQRISFESDALDEELDSHIRADTEVINVADEAFPVQLPIYEITERNISEQDIQQMLQNLGLPQEPSAWKMMELDGNRISCNLVRYTDFSRGYFDMTEDELEQLAWDVFNKIPFIVGDYEYLGITGKMTVNDSKGDHISRVGVSFSRIVGGIRALGEDDCTFYFDGSGLVEIHITLFDYEKIGTMDLVTLEDAAARIKTPDDFNIDAESGVVQTLQVDRIKLLLVNQYSEGCTILQPIYNFIGTATLQNGTQAEFSSKVIAIPESYTYEKIQFE